MHEKGTDEDSDAALSSHPAIAKRIRALHLAKRRAETGRTLVEGPKLVHEALASGVRLVEVAAVAAALEGPEGAALLARLEETGVPVHRVTERVLGTLFDVETQRGIIAVAETKATSLEVIAHPDRSPLLVVAVGIQDPGNVGALVRTAEAFGATGLVVLGGADPWGPKAVRGSAGSVFRVHIASAGEPAAALDLLRTRGYTIAAAVRDGGQPPETALATRPLAIVLGSEGSGLPAVVLERSDARVTIPLRAPVESLNVGAAAAVLLYAATTRP